VIVFLAALLTAAGATSEAQTASQATTMLAVGGIYGLVIGAVMFVSGLILIGFGQLFYCVRDMARNSFLLRPMR
jgi:hypothetical protein